MKADKNNRNPTKNQISNLTKKLFKGKRILCFSSAEFLRIAGYLKKEGFKTKYKTDDELKFKVSRDMINKKCEVVCMVMATDGYILHEIPNEAKIKSSDTITASSFFYENTFNREETHSFKQKKPNTWI